ncbi:MAG TPA: polysaccharide biosynthesis tyrosine autokinase [Candidatus Sulfotelmatobacter sp.]
MELQSPHDHPSESEALEPIELPVLEGHQYSYIAEEVNPLVHYWRILRKRRWTVAAVLTTVLALYAIATLKTTRLYQATSKVAIFPETPNIMGFKGGEDALPDFQYDVTLETQAAILRSDALAMKVIDALHLDQNSDFVGPTQLEVIDSNRASITDSDQSRISGLLGAFHGGLSVELIPNSRLLQISYTHPNPLLATEIVNTLVKTFVEENFKARYESVTQTSQWLSTSLADLQQKVQISEEKLVHYQKEHGILGVDEKQNIVTAKLDELNTELTQAQTDRMQKEANYKLAATGEPVAFTKTSREGVATMLERLRERETELSLKYAEARTQFGSAYPKVVELNNQLKQMRIEIAQEETRMQHRNGDEYRAAVQRENLLTAAFEQQKQQANQLNESAIEYSVLKRDAESNRQLYQDLLQRLKEAGVSAGLKSSNIRVVDAARPPSFPITPNVPRNLKLGLLLGLVLGVGLAFVLESVDTSVKNIEEVSEITTLPALGTIPLQISGAGHLRKRLKIMPTEAVKVVLPSLVAFACPKSEAAEAYRALRSSILLSSWGSPPKVILVTSALPQEGKTTISANSAVVLAQSGSRVLLIDADLRRPSIHRLFGLQSRVGLSSLISGVAEVKDVVRQDSHVPNLSIVPAGPIPPQPAELLGSRVMKDLLTNWRNEFDHIVIDTPPCLSVTDAVVLSPEADQIILVARSGETTKTALRRACNVLLQVNARVMGIVLNALNMHSPESYYYGKQYAGRDQDKESPEDEPTATIIKVS